MIKPARAGRAHSTLLTHSQLKASVYPHFDTICLPLNDIVIDMVKLRIRGGQASFTLHTLDITLSPLLSLPNSSFEQFSDGMTLGWGVVAAMVATWASMVLRKGL